jgi:hypothetical protein
MRATTFLHTSFQSEVYTQSYGPPKLWESQLWAKWESWDKMSFGCCHVASHRVYYKGEGGGFPQVRAVVSLLGPNLPMVRLSTKSVQIMF